MDKLKRCGDCGLPLRPVVYGKPGRQVLLMAARGEIILRGCVLPADGGDEWGCPRCDPGIGSGYGHDALSEVAASVLKVSVDSLHSFPILEYRAWYFWSAGRGSGAVIVGEDLSVLFAVSAINYDDHVAAFVAGRRTSL